MAKDKLDIKAGAYEDFDTGIDVGTLTPEERVIYDKLNAQVRKAYLQKTSTLAGDKQKWEKEMQELKQQHEEAVKAATAWQQWWQAEGQYMTKAEQRQAMREEGLEEPSAVQREIQQLRQEFQAAATQYNKVIGELQSQLGASQQALSMSTRLNDLRFKHPEMDPMRVLETAKERGIQDMELAYQLSYGDELRDQQVKSEVEKQVAEEKAKWEAEKNVVDTTPSTTRYAPPSEAKSYAEAGKNLLDSVRKGGNVGTI